MFTSTKKYLLVKGGDSIETEIRKCYNDRSQKGL